MANDTQRNDAASKRHPDNDSPQQPDKRNADEKSAIRHPPVEQVNPDHGGLNPDHLGPAQPRKPGE